MMTIVWCSKCGELDYCANGELVEAFITTHGHGVVKVGRDEIGGSIRQFLEEAAAAHPWPETLR